LQARLPEHALALVVGVVSRLASLASHSARVADEAGDVRGRDAEDRGPEVIWAHVLAVQPVASASASARCCPDAAALGHRLGLHEHRAALLAVLLDLEDLAVGGLDLRGEVRADGDLRPKRSSSTAIACRLFSLAWAAWRMRRPAAFDGGAQVGDLAAVLAAGREAGVVSPGRLPHRARSLASYSVSICNAVAASAWVFCS
jgi:hypothetical protein